MPTSETSTNALGAIEAALLAQPEDVSRLEQATLLGRCFQWIELVAGTLVGAALLTEFGVLVANMLARKLLSTSFVWSDEVAHYALSVMAFGGGALAYKRGHQVAVLVLVNRLPASWQRGLAVVTDGFCLAVACLMFWNSLPLLSAGLDQHSAVLGIPSTVGLIPLTVGSALLAVFAVERIVAEGFRASLLGAGAAAGVVLVLTFAWLSLTAGVAVEVLTIALIALFFVALLAGVPIGFALALAAFGLGYSAAVNVPSTVVRVMNEGVSSFLLLAIPFFVLAGLIMAHGGLGQRIANLVGAAIGHTPGGALHSIIASMYLFSGLSGSKMADMAVVGTTLVRTVEKQGYSRGEISAVLAASAVMGETIPPSIVILVMASITTLSVATLFVAGILPAAVLALCLMALVYWRNRKGEMQRPTFSWGSLRINFFKAIPSVLLPALLLVGITAGVATPTEVSSIAVVYGLLLALLYREMTWRKAWLVLQDTAAMTGLVLFIVSGATAFAWTLSIERVPHTVATVVTQAHNPYAFLLASVVALVVFGALLEGLPAILIFTPILFPAATLVGVNQLHLGIVAIIAMALGVFFPYLGVGVYVACTIASASVEEVSRRLVPYWLVLLVGLGVLVVFPQIVLAGPRLLHISGV